mgnify:CR=1 FL=1
MVLSASWQSRPRGLELVAVRRELQRDELVVVADAESIHVVPRRRLVASLRGSLRTGEADGTDLVAELLADRRRDAAVGR